MLQSHQGAEVTVEVAMDSFKRTFDPLDLEIIDRVYEVAWAYVEAREPDRNTARDGERQRALRKRIFGVARIDFDTLTEVVLATIPERSKNADELSRTKC
jgi:hypothetical protein